MKVNMAGLEAAALDVSDTRAKHDNSLASNAMGTSDLVFTVLAALAPLTLMVAVAPLHFLKGGSAVPGGFILAGCIMAMFAVGFMAMSRYVQNAGAFYSVIAKGLGKPTGSGAAMVALLAYNSLQISTYGAFGLYADEALGRYLGVAIPWWGYALAAWCCVAWLGYHGIHTSARVLACILVAEILILVVLAIAVGVSGGPEGFPEGIICSFERSADEQRRNVHVDLWRLHGFRINDHFQRRSTRRASDGTPCYLHRGWLYCCVLLADDRCSGHRVWSEWDRSRRPRMIQSTWS